MQNGNVFFFQDLRIKNEHLQNLGEVLDKKITEIYHLKSQLSIDVCRKTELGSLEVPISVADVAEEEIIKTSNLSSSNQYQTFPKQKNKNHQNPPKTPERPVKRVTLRKSSSARHSVQICQVNDAFFLFCVLSDSKGFLVLFVAQSDIIPVERLKCVKPFQNVLL